ncbi:MAG: hypothetical protein FWG46_03030, partial [Treponema sp.]|nr:hypothetical protein [Treponema sp.]
GFEEKYGMEYRRAYRDEEPDGYLVDRHEREIFPLMKRRALFSGSSEFRLYDVYTEGGTVNENVFAYTNRANIHGNEERALIFFNNSYYETAGWINISDPAIPQIDGSKRRDSLHTALALHNGDTWFTLFRDQHSDLWFIRSSKAICENGFFVALKGYEAQVFIDIHEIEDDEKGRWARLHHDLQGRGVNDPHSAIMDIYLGDLYYRFAKILKPEIVSQLHGFFNTGASGKKPTPSTKAAVSKTPAAFIESIKEQAMTYFTTVRHFIGGADGKFDAWQQEAVSDQGSGIGDGQLWEEFKNYLERLIGLAKYAGTSGKNPAERLLKELAGQLGESQLVCAAALGYGLLAILRPLTGSGSFGSTGAAAENLAFDHWGLDRKLREQYGVFGASNDIAWRLAEISRLVLGRTGNNEQGIENSERSFNAEQFAAALFDENCLLDEFRRIIGINVFNDVTWFNKEAFENAMFYGKLFLVLENDSAFSSKMAWLDRAGYIGEVCEAIEKAEAASGYRLDHLICLLAGEELPAEPKEKPVAPKAKPAAAKAKTETPKTKPAAKAKPEKPAAAKTKAETPKTKPAAKAKTEAAKPKPVAPKAKPAAAKKKAAEPKAKTSAEKTKPAASKAKPAAAKTKTETPKTKADAAKTKPAAKNTKSEKGKKKG